MYKKCSFDIEDLRGTCRISLNECKLTGAAFREIILIGCLLPNCTYDQQDIWMPKTIFF